MRRIPFVLLAVVLPLTALALDYTDQSTRYTDAPFSHREAAGISVLTNLGVVSGNPDGTFAPTRTLNRAEFTKIVMQLRAFHPSSVSSASSAGSVPCFPDVQPGVWYEGVVCQAKAAGIISGYQRAGVPAVQWLFEPSRPVLYAEAVKMLVSSYNLPIPVVETLVAEQWYEPFIRAAGAAGISLPGMTQGTPITRGQMARLAAMFEANAQGELAMYMRAEQGSLSVSSSSVSLNGSSDSSNSTSSVASTSSSSLSSTPVVYGPKPELPARNHLILLGQLSAPIASGTFYSPLEPVIVRTAKVKLKAKADYISSLTLTDADGVVIGKLFLDSSDADKLTWKATFPTGSGAYEIPKEGQRVLAVEALVKGWSDGGVAEKLLQVDTFTIVTQGEWSMDTYSFAPQSYDFPQHQTVQAKITGVTNVGPSDNIIPRGAGQLVAAFAFSGTTLQNASLRIQQLEFAVSKSGMAVQNWQLGTLGSNDRIPCSVNDTVVSCLSLPDTFGTIDALSGRILQLYGDVAVDDGAQHPMLEVDLAQAGQIGTNGAVRWTDGVGYYTWTELSTPIARGTHWSE